MISLGVVGCLATVTSAMALTAMSAALQNVPDCAEPCYRSAAQAVGCATQNQIECRCGTSEDQRARLAAAQCFRATCASGEFDDAMRFADIVCISSDDTRPTEVRGDDQEELDDMEPPVSTLSVSNLPEDEKQRTPATGSPGSTLVSVTTGQVPVETAPPSSGDVSDSSGRNEDVPTSSRWASKGAQAGIAIGAVMSALVLAMAGYLVVIRIRKARAAKAAREAAVGDESSTSAGPSRPDMSELCGRGGRGGYGGVVPGGDDGGTDGKPKGTGDGAQASATELETARSPPPHYCHEMYVEPAELDSRPVVVSPMGASPTGFPPMEVSPLEPQPGDGDRPGPERP